MSRAAGEPSALFHGKNSLAPARMACRIRSGSAAPATAKIAMFALDARSRSIAAMPDDASRADVDDHEVGSGAFRGPSLDDAYGHAAGANQPGHLALEFLVVTDNLCGELRHGPCATSLLNETDRLSGTRPAGRRRRRPCACRRSA